MKKTEIESSKRKKVSMVISNDVLVKSRRRCCLCYVLKGDKDTKDGQIAHIDRNPANNAIDNLVYLCLDHHNQYDSVPSQSKRLSSAEVKLCKRLLYKKLGTSGTQWKLIIEGTVDRYPCDKIHEIINQLSELVDGAEITIKEISEGSVVINLESTEEVYQKLRRAFKRGTLSESLGLTILAIERKHKAKAISLVRLGEGLLDERDVDNAILCSNTAIENDPENPSAWSLKVTALILKFHLHEKGKGDNALLMQAQYYANRINEMFPDYPPNLVNEGIILFETNQVEEALSCLERAVNLRPDYAAAWYTKGSFLYAINRHKEAIRALETAAKLGFEKASSVLNAAKRRTWRPR